MKINSALFKKVILVGLIWVIALLAMPPFHASAANLGDEGPPPAKQSPSNQRLERIWTRAQNIYERQDERLARSDKMINRVQSLIDRANQKDWDTTTVQTALDAFAAVIPTAQTAHNEGAVIIVNHAGFDDNGKVIDRTQAVETIKALRAVLQNTHNVMNGAGKTLRAAIKTFRESHQPGTTPTP